MRPRRAAIAGVPAVRVAVAAAIVPQARRGGGQRTSEPVPSVEDYTPRGGSGANLKRFSKDGHRSAGSRRSGDSVNSCQRSFDLIPAIDRSLFPAS